MSNLIPKLSGLITHSYMKFEMFYTVLSLFLLVGVNNTNAIRKEKIKQEMNKIKSILNASYTAILDIQKNIAVLKDIPSLKIDVLLTNLEKKLEQNLQNSSLINAPSKSLICLNYCRYGYHHS